MANIPVGFWNRKKRIEMIILAYRSLLDSYEETEQKVVEIRFSGAKIQALELDDPQLLKAKRAYYTIPEIKKNCNNPYHFRRKKYHSKSKLTEFDYYY